MAARATRSQYNVMARPASSLPGTTKVMPLGSEFVSTMAATGMLRRRASAIAMSSLLVSITKIMSGRPPMSLIPPSERSSLSRSRCSVSRSFLVYWAPSPEPSISSSCRSRLIEPDTVFQLVRVPPSQRELTKYCAERFAASATPSCACRLVPTNRIRPPLATVSLTACSARCSSGTVWAKSMIWMLLRAPKM